MTLWTLGTAMSEATAAIGNRADLSSSRASLYANQAALDIAFAVEPQEWESIAVSSTTSGENKITLPTDFYAVMDVSNLSTSPPTNLTKFNYMDIDSQTTTQGRPDSYVMYSTWMELWPSPDSSYSIQLRYQARPSVMTLTSAVPSFDTRFGIAWMYKTASYCAYGLKDWEAGALMDQKYLAEIARIPSDLALRQRDRTGQNVKLVASKAQRPLLFDNSDGPSLSIYGP